ncbi:MAG: sugar phosphate nucleotidyltransferase [Simkaniaceae bacterium]|nr:sugar phosphate nucleotidyltransferase [Simkaniaceae bacterium]
MTKAIRKKHQHHHPVDEVATIILAGGEGTRLYPLTKSRCKPAVCFGGRYRLIDIPISNSLNSGIPHIFVIGQYLASSLNSHIRDTFSLDAIQGGWIELLQPEEAPENEDLLYKGTADCVRKNLKHLKETPSEYFLLLSGDQLYNMDLEKLIEFAEQQDTDLTIAAFPVTREEAPRLGLMQINEKAIITEFAEKPKDDATLDRFEVASTDQGKTHLASMGIYVFKRKALFDILENEIGNDFGKDLIPTIQKKGQASAFIYDGYWEDIGTVASYYQANLSLTKNDLGLDLYNEQSPIFAKRVHVPCARLINTTVTDSIICQGSIVRAQEITNSIVGLRSTIDKGTIIRDSILLGNQFYETPEKLDKTYPKNLSIGKDCHIERAIIDEHASIGNNVTLTNKDNHDTYDGDGIYIRDGIIIVPGSTTLPDGFTL